MNSSVIGLVNNAALLLALGLLYDLMQFGHRVEKSISKQISTGLILGSIGIAIMLNPWDFGQGIVFDTRSVLLCISGFFFGTIPLLLAVLITSFFRLSIGGAGAWIGVAVIVTSGGIGLAWRHLHRDRKENPTMGELYLLGIVVHIIMLVWMLALPWQVALEVLSKITLPVMLIHPIATALLGKLMVNRGKHKRSEEALRASDQDLKESQRIAHVGSWRLDLASNQVVWSEELYRMYGFDPTSPPPPYTEHQKLFTPESWNKLSTALNSTKDTGIPYELELETLREDGNRGWMWVHGEAVSDKNGRIVGLRGATQDITERKHAEEKLRQSHDLLVNLACLVPGVIYQYRLNPDGSFAFPWSSPGMNDIYEVTPEEVKEDATLVFGRLHPEDLEMVSNAIQESARTLNTFYCEFRVILPRQGLRWRWSQAQPERTEDGGTLWHGIISDITERKQMDDALREREQHYRNLFDQANEGLTIMKLDGQLTDVNQAFADMHGYTIDELKQMDISNIDILKKRTLEDRADISRRIQAGETVRFEVEHYHKDRHIFPLSVTVSLIHMGDKAYYLCFHQDITERKQAEITLRESEEKFRNFTEQSFVGFYIIQDGLFKYVNPKFADIFGYTVDECIDNMHFHQLVHPDDFALVQEQVRRREEKEIRAVQYTFRGIKKTGETIHVEIHGSSLLFKGRLAAIGTMLDITRELEIKKQLAQSQKMESIGTLAGGIAHDFNNILYPIIGFAEMLTEDLPNGSSEHESAQEIFNAGKRGGELVKQILAFSRQSDHKKQPIRIQNVLREVLKLTRSSIPIDIELHQDIQQDCGLVLAEETQLHQIAMNLITNAYHAVERTSGKILVQLKEIMLDNDELQGSPLQPGQYVMFSVSDDGIGIPRNVMNKIFEPYFTTKEKGKGTGLGLAVVYGIVKEHKGDIKVYSEEGKGTTFKVYLPLMKESTEAAVNDQGLNLQTGTENLLLVDDEESVVRLEKQMLERLGYNVVIQSNSLAALETFKANPYGYDLVITDMTMPNMTGDQLAKELISIRHDIPVIICTGFSERINKEKAESYGIKGFLMKPVVKSDMAAMVRNVLYEAKGSDHHE